MAAHAESSHPAARTLLLGIATSPEQAAQALAEGPRLVEEMEAFQVKITERGRDTYAAAVGAHDDLVVALALACWFGELVTPARIIEEDDRPLSAWDPEVLAYEAHVSRLVKPSKPPGRQVIPEAF